MNSLQERLKRAATKTAKPTKTAGSPKTAAQKGGARAGRVLIGGHFDVTVRQRLLKIRAEHPERTLQDLLEEALDLLFRDHGQPRLR